MEEAEVENLATKSDHSLDEKMKVLNTYEVISQIIKRRWTSYEVEQKKNIFKLFKQCFGDEIKLIEFEDSDLEDGDIKTFSEDDIEDAFEDFEDFVNSGIEEEKDEAEEDKITKISLEEMKKKFFKEYIIVWHDPDVNSQVNQQYLKQLKELEFFDVKTFPEWSEASNKILKETVECLVITSGINGKKLVEKIYSRKNVSEIYIFCKNQEDHSTWAKEYPERLSIETQIWGLMGKIQLNLRKWYKEPSSLKSNLPTYTFALIPEESDESQIRSLHQSVLSFKNRLQAKKDFLMLSRAIDLKKDTKRLIEKFRQNYKAYKEKTIFRWYKRSCFFHTVVNNCLKMATSDSIQYCRLPLSDLERAIKEQYNKKSKSFNGVLYRGTFLTEKEWELLTESTGRKIETLAFFSTSKNFWTALSFAEKYPPNESVLMTIIVRENKNEEEQGFADIEGVEEEVLFNVRSRFMILKTEDEYSDEFLYRHLILEYGTRKSKNQSK